MKFVSKGFDLNRKWGLKSSLSSWLTQIGWPWNMGARVRSLRSNYRWMLYVKATVTWRLTELVILLYFMNREQTAMNKLIRHAYSYEHNSHYVCSMFRYDLAYYHEIIYDHTWKLILCRPGETLILLSVIKLFKIHVSSQRYGI